MKNFFIILFCFFLFCKSFHFPLISPSLRGENWQLKKSSKVSSTIQKMNLCLHLIVFLSNFFLFNWDVLSFLLLIKKTIQSSLETFTCALCTVFFIWKIETKLKHIIKGRNNVLCERKVETNTSKRRICMNSF